MSSPSPPYTPAELAAIRMVKYRRRQRLCLHAVRVEICTEVITELVDEGRLSQEGAEDLVAVGDALAEQINDRALGKPTTEDID